jgi:hypothetical protein
MLWNSLFNPMALGPIVVNVDPLFIRIEKFPSLQMTTMSLTTFLFYIYTLNGNVVGSDTCMRCLINGQELNLGYD